MIELRNIEPKDLEVFFEHQLDPIARHMAASTTQIPADRAAFVAKWERNLANPSIKARTIVLAGQPVGYLATFLRDETREVAYWIGREHWGRGIATTALTRFLGESNDRPVHARVAADKVGSLRVLEKCGFKWLKGDRFFSPARGEEVDEHVLLLA